MSSSDSDSDRSRSRPLTLAQVLPESFGPQSHFRGQVDTVKPYSNGTASLKVKDDTGVRWILLAGDWAEDAIRYLNRIGKWIVLNGQGGSVQAIQDKYHQDVLNDEGFKTYRVIYKQGISGKYNGKVFTFKGKPSRSTEYSTGSTNPHPRASLTSTSKQQRELARLNQNNLARPQSIDQEILAAPTVDLVNPYDWVTSRTNDPLSEKRENNDSSAASTRQESEGEDVDQPPRKKTMRVRSIPRKEWGLKTSTLEYSTLSHVDNLRNEKKNAAKLNLIAIAVAKREVYQSKSDVCSEIWLYDPTHTNPTMRLCHFGPDEANVPVVEDGDILIVQNLNWQKDRAQLTAFGRNFKSGPFLVVPSKLAEEYRPGQGPELLAKLAKSPKRPAIVGEEELLYARDVAHWSKKFDVVGNHLAPAREDEKEDLLAVSARLSKGGGNRRKQVTISEIQDGSFYDVQGEIVKFFKPSNYKSLNDLDSCQLYIVDYSRNDQLLAYDERSEVRLPGQYVLQISVWGHQAQPLLKWSEEALKGKFVYCRNLLGKTNGNRFLEGNMFIDIKRRDQSDITIRSSDVLKTPWGTAFQRRRDLYCNSTMEEKLHSEFLTLGTDQAVEAKTAQDPFASVFDTDGLEKQPMSTACALKLGGTYLFDARVIDFKPDKLEDFVVAYCTQCRAPLAAGLRACMDHNQVSHMYRFSLVLEGQSSSPQTKPIRIVVQVTGRDAEALFPGLAAAEFFNDPIKSSSSLRSRLAPIVGPLFVAKSQRQPGMHLDEAAASVMTDDDVGPWRDFVVEGWRTDGSGELRWKFDEDRTMFA